MINITRKLFELEFYGGAAAEAEEISGIMKKLVYDDEPNYKTLEEWQKKIKSSEIEDIQTSISNLVASRPDTMWEKVLRSGPVISKKIHRMVDVPNTTEKGKRQKVDGSPYRPKDDIQDWLDDEDLTNESSKIIFNTLYVRLLYR